MKIGVLTNVFRNMSLEEAIVKFKSMGIEALEIGCGGYPGNNHCNPEKLLASDEALSEWLDVIKRHGMEISALSVHGNPVHPDKAEAERYHKEFVNTVLLAEKIGIDTVVTFSGCPGGSPEDKMPNWVTCHWPNEYPQILDYQWNEVLIPYWKKTAEFAKAHGVTKIALEMHPGFCVYNPSSLMRLRDAVGDVIGANFDPSHLIWQGIDPSLAVRNLAGAIYHFHAKDTRVDKYNAAANGVLDTQPYANELTRSWIFRSVGYGNGLQFWRDMISALRLAGYDKVMSIEHEDSLMTGEEGLRHAAEFLNQSIIREVKPTKLQWV